MLAGHWDELASFRSQLPEPLYAALMRLAATDWSQVPDGRLDFGGKNYVNVETVRTEPATERKWEAHREYVDVQILLSGQERLDWAILPVAEPVEAYPERDLYFYGGCELRGSICAIPGSFTILYPTDAHRPLVSSGTPQEVRKAVLKWYIGNKK